MRFGSLITDSTPQAGRQPATSFGFNQQPSPGEGNKSGHRLRWLVWILGGLLIIVFVAVFLCWRHYETTPAYSLALLVDAAQRNDVPAFDQMIDLEKVVDSFTAEIAQKATGSDVSNLTPSLRIQLQSVAPEVTARIKLIIKEEIRKHINELAGPSGARPFLLTALAMPFAANISEQDDRAKATINSADHPVELLMERRDGPLWRVISLRDDALAERIVNSIVRDLPGPGTQLDQEIRKQLRENLPAELPKLPPLKDK